MSQSLDDYIKSNSKYLKLSDGESFEGTYLGYRIAPSSFDPDKDTVHYRLRYADGKETTMQTGSTKLARDICKIKEGTLVRITRTGTGMKTKYTVVAKSSVEEPGVSEHNASSNPDALPF